MQRLVLFWGAHVKDFIGVVGRSFLQRGFRFLVRFCTSLLGFEGGPC